jgi:diguanylate cyclase (GGDEF)-like protein
VLDPARFRNVIAISALVLGLALAAIGAVAWHRYIQGQASGNFVADTSSVSAAVATALRRDVDFVASQQAVVTSIPNLTNKQLAVWYRSMDIGRHYPGGVGLGFVQRVLPSQLDSFGAEVVADPPVNEPVAAPYTVFPAGPRPQYCLQRFGMATSDAAQAIPPTFDFCSPTIPPYSNRSPIPQLLGAATDTGHATVLAAGRIAQTTRVADLIVVFSPVYFSSATPASVATREADMRGWVIGTFSGLGLLHSGTGADRGLAVSLLFDGSGPGGTTIASSGKTPSGALFTHTLRFNADGSWIVHVVGSAHSTATAQAVAVGALGVILSLLLFLLLALLTRSRTVAMRLVNRRNDQLEHQSLHDALTDLPNRALILDRAEQMLIRAKRQPLSVGALFIDLDNLKKINDTFGHETGDQVLQAVGVRLSEALRASDSVGRLGGDEFVVLAEGDLGGVGPELVAERLLAVLAHPFNLKGRGDGPLVVSASIGVALGHRESAAELLHDAEVALDEAKAQGRHGCVVFRPEMQAALEERLGIELGLQSALAKGELRLVYQPTFDLRDMTVTGVEALLRWHHPVRGAIAPETLIPIAEDTGLIVSIGQFVLDQACAQAQRWHAAGYPVAMAVNVSGRQLERDDLVDHVKLALEKSGLGAAWLTLEITETVLMRDQEACAGRLRLLKSLGVQIAIDDFGTGYSSLAYLRQFPVDCLKIDRSFVTNIAQSTEAGALIHTLVELGKTLGIETLAEGIEKEVQLAHLQREHCDSGQGFLFSRPVEVGDVEAFLEKRRMLSLGDPHTRFPSSQTAR